MRSTYLYFCFFFSLMLWQTHPHFGRYPQNFSFLSLRILYAFTSKWSHPHHIPTTPASLSTNHTAAGQLCPVAMETWLLIFRTSLTLIRDRPHTVEKSMGLSSSKRTAVQQGRKKKREIESELKSFVVFFCVTGLVPLPGRDWTIPPSRIL